MTRSGFFLRSFWLLALVCSAILIVLSAVSYFLIDLLAVIRFVSSLEWQERTRFVTGPLVLVPAALLCWPQILPGYIEEVETRILNLCGRVNTKSVVGETHEHSFWFVVYVFLSPLLVWYAVVIFITVWIPMASAALSYELARHEVVIKELDKGGYRTPNRFTLEGHTAFGNDIVKPPRQIWNTAKPGDLLILRGLGNAVGLFYYEIELIKKQ